MNTLGINPTACDMNERELLRLVHLAGRPVTLKDAVGAVPRWAAEALARLLTAGKVEPVERDRYRLTPLGIETMLRPSQTRATGERIASKART